MQTTTHNVQASWPTLDTLDAKAPTMELIESEDSVRVTLLLQEREQKLLQNHEAKKLAAIVKQQCKTVSK